MSCRGRRGKKKMGWILGGGSGGERSMCRTASRIRDAQVMRPAALGTPSTPKWGPRRRWGGGGARILAVPPGARAWPCAAAARGE